MPLPLLGPLLGSDLHPGSLGLVDLAIALIVVGSMIGALKRRAGLLAAIGSGLGAAIFCWLIAAGVLLWAPQSASQAVAASAFAHHVPLPTHALTQAGHLVGAAVASIG